MEYESGTGHTVNWYVSRRVDVPAGDLREVALPATVTGEDGVTLTIGQPIFVDDESYRSFEAVLTFPGTLQGRLRVELDLNPYSSRYGELGLRPANRVPRLLVGADRYFAGAWSALDALAGAVAAGRPSLKAVEAA